MPSKKDQIEIDYSVEIFEHYRDTRRQLEDRVVVALKCYRAWDDEYISYRNMYGDEGWRSTLYFPIVYANIETLAPKIVMSIAAEPDFAQLVPTEENDVRHVAPMTTITMKQWADMEAFDQILAQVKSNLLCGFAWGKYGWKYEEEVRPVKVPKMSFRGTRAGSKITQQRITVVNRPDYMALPPERVYWDQSITGKMEQSLVIQDRYFATRSAIRDMAVEGDWKNVDNINYDDTPTFQDEMETTRRRLHWDVQEEESGRRTIRNKWHQKAEVIETYGLDSQGHKRWKLVTINRKVLAFNDKNPHASGRPPFIFTKNSHLPGQVTGSPESEYAEPMNRMINNLRNYHIDNVNLAVNGMWVKSRFADIDDNQLVSRPWGTIETNDMEGLRPLERPPVTQDALIEARQLEEDIKTTSGVVDYFRGTQGPGQPDTATAVERLTAGAQSRFSARIKSTQNTLIKGLWQVMIRLNIQNLGPEVAVRIAGKDGINFTKLNMDNIHGDFDIQVKTYDENLPRSVRQNQLLVLYNLFRGDPEINQRELKHLIITQFIPGAESKIIMPASEDLTPEEENLVLMGGGLVVPLPNDQHPEHIRMHLQFMQEHANEMDPVIAKLFQNHIKSHTEIQASVYQGLGQPQSAAMGQIGGPDNINRLTGAGGQQPSGELGSLADTLSATGGRNVTQRPA